MAPTPDTAADCAATPAVLVTRPAGAAADSLCAQVEAAGYRAHRQPLLELQPLSQLPPRQRSMLLGLDNYRHVIFISTNAVRYGMALVEDHWPQLPVGLNWYAIGQATASALAHYGIEARTAGGAMTSESLLALPSLQAVTGQRVLIVKGEGGRDQLRSELGRRGAVVEELACYRRLLPALAAGELAARLVRSRIDVILLSSGEGLANLQVLLSPAESTKFKHLCLVVPSERVARLARNAGFEQVVSAENASDHAMLRALAAWQVEWKPAQENK